MSDRINRVSPTMISLSTGVTLIRIGKLRILHFEGAVPIEEGLITTLDTLDRPNTIVRSTIMIYSPFYTGVCFINPANNRVEAYFVTAIGQSIIPVPTSLVVYGELVWTIA